MNPHKKAVLMHEFKKAANLRCNSLVVDDYASIRHKIGILTNIRSCE